MQGRCQGQCNTCRAGFPHGSRQRIPQSCRDTSPTGGTEDAHAREIENLASLPQGSPAITALRTRIIARFTELETERTQINDRLTALERATSQRDEPALLDALPILGDILTDAPASLQAPLFAAFGLELIYNKEDHQVSIYATSTPSTPQALADIIAASEPPTVPGGRFALSPQHPEQHQDSHSRGMR